MLSGVGLVGGNPTMNTPRLRRGGDSFFFKFIFTCSGTPIVNLVCDSASELERWAIPVLPFWDFLALT